MLNGIKNFLEILNENWTTILIISGIIISIVQKSIKYFNKTKDEKIAIAKEQITHQMLKFIDDAEKDYKYWKKAGELKRAQVIGKIFKEYSVLSRVVDQKDLIKWIDDTIDDSLVTLRKMLENNESTDDES